MLALTGVVQSAQASLGIRVGVYEVLRMNAELRRLVAAGGTTEAISAAAIQSGMITLKDYSVWLLKNGWTTMDEVLQVVAVHE